MKFICINADVDKESEIKIKNILMNIADLNVLKSIDKGYTSFIEAKESDFENIAKTLGL